MSMIQVLQLSLFLNINHHKDDYHIFIRVVTFSNHNIVQT